MGVTFIAKEGTYTAPATLTTKTITENGTYSASGDNANGYSSVTVNVPLPTGKITITENGTNIDVTQYAKADVNVAGGSSDFSTAKLTYVVIGQVALSPIYISRIYDNAVTSVIPNAGTYDVVLYNGVAYGMLDTDDNVSVDGAIEYDDGDLTITGDCTITIS